MTHFLMIVTLIFSYKYIFINSFTESLFLFIYFSVYSMVTLVLACLLILLNSIHSTWVPGGSWRKPSHPSVWPGRIVPALAQWHGESSWLGHNCKSQRVCLTYCSSIPFNKKYFSHICCLHPSQYLSCLSSSHASTDKLAFDVGLQEDKAGIWCF